MKSDIQKKVTQRLNIAQGQIKGLQKMIAEEQYCIDIITQISAVQRALASIERLMLENHLSTHVVEQVKAGKESKAVEEILKVYKLAQRKQ